MAKRKNLKKKSEARRLAAMTTGALYDELFPPESENLQRLRKAYRKRLLQGRETEVKKLVALGEKNRVLFEVTEPDWPAILKEPQKGEFKRNPNKERLCQIDLRHGNTLEFNCYYPVPLNLVAQRRGAADSAIIVVKGGFHTIVAKVRLETLKKIRSEARRASYRLRKGGKYA